MNYFTKEKLLTTIKDYTTLIELDSGESTVIISEYSGRPIGIFPKDSIYNLQKTEKKGNKRSRSKHKTRRNSRFDIIIG